MALYEFSYTRRDAKIGLTILDAYPILAAKG